MNDRSDPSDRERDDQIDAVMIVGIVGLVLYFGLEFIVKTVGPPLFGSELLRVGMGVAVPMYILWMIYRFYWYPSESPTAQSELNEFVDKGSK